VSREFNYIVRIHGTNLDGNKTVPYALTDIRGVGVRLARAVVKNTGINPSIKLGNLSDADVRKLETAIEDPKNLGVPTWFINRRKDPHTGMDEHLLTSDLDFRIKEDIDMMKETRSWKGVRHHLGLKTRGQRTKTTARKGRSVGVSRRSVRRQ
jgi:small subunit ribosomal protein S13